MGFSTLRSKSQAVVPSETKLIHRPRLNAAAAWVVFCAFCSFTGWVLSLARLLNALGYLLAFGAAIIAVFIWRSIAKVRLLPLSCFSKWRRRFSRPISFGFLVLATLAFLGGALHSPSNYDGLAYRTPRVLHWLAEERWHWIHTEFARLNVRGCAFEWMTAPLFALARTDRFEFLISVISFLLLPGRLFSIWIQLGARPRAAWQWMWIVPSGYCYLLQAGSIANDLFGALLALAAMEYALRARNDKRMGSLLIGILAAALMTSGKAFNLLLLLPWAVAVAPCWRLVLRRPIISGFALFVAASVSLLPTAWLNYEYSHDWTGQKAEGLVVVGSADPLFRLGVNGVLIILHNFTPPIFPFANGWEDWMHKLIPAGLSLKLHQNFEPSAARFAVDEMQMEETAGIGMGISGLLLVVAYYRWRHRVRERINWSQAIKGVLDIRLLMPLCALLATIVFMTQAGLACPARYLSPFYPLLIAPLLAGGGRWLHVLSRAWWHRMVMIVYFAAAVLLVVSPARPLWPAVTILKAFGAEASPNSLVRRAWKVYSVYGVRGNAFEPALKVIPTDANPLGLVTSDDPEASLWRPFGARRIEHVINADNPEDLRRRNIRYVLVNSFIVTNHYEMSKEQWLAKYHAKMIADLTLTLRAGKGPVDWWLVKTSDSENEKK